MKQEKTDHFVHDADRTVEKRTSYRNSRIYQSASDNGSLQSTVAFSGDA